MSLEDQVAELVTKLGEMIRARRALGLDIRTDEIRNFIRKNAHVGDFKSLAVTMITLAEAGVGEEDEGEEWKNEDPVS